MKEQGEHRIKPKRPFILSFLCIIGFTYTILFSLLFLLGMLYSTGISGMFDQYFRIYDLSRLNFLLFALAGFLVFFASFIGILLMWKLQFIGFFIYAAAAILFVLIEVIISGVYLPDIIINGTFILLFFIIFLYINKKKKALKNLAAPEYDKNNEGDQPD